ncbi:glycosyltransferase [Clostridium sp. FP2]|uniref:glycosyltransferase n=1 Tax=Clostridium sp. FP2 TaxID=2724481 RepID=UPI0013E98BC6|nr:glycosyltransferase [Clostridium sp. FP2]MBZ9622613.1 glycosyltransferase [Clostridium sp. FP2]
MKLEYSLFNRLKDIQSSSFLNDFGGGDPLSKCYIMAYLASFFKLKNYVEIGVYKGRSLFSVAQAFKDNEGKAYGIDPYLLVDEMYNQVLINTEVFQLSKVVEIIRKTSIEAASYFKAIKIDMLHINGYHDYESVQADINNYTPLIREGGIIVFDSLNVDYVKRCYDQYKNDYIILLETNNFGILMKNQKNQKNLDSAVVISKKMNNLYSRLIEIENKTVEKKTTVNVGVIAYNHEKYIVDCLNSIIIQKGDFNLNIVICEDKSTDGTAAIIEAYIKYVPVGKNVTFEYLRSEVNLGMVKNLKRLLEACSKSKYTALIDGDDYWDDENKLQSHIEFMESHPECSMSFDDITVKNEDKYHFYNIQQQIKGDIFSTLDITSINFIGNISCCFYYSKYLDQLPNGFYEMFVGDWMLNIIYSLFGEIGHIKKAMTIYRKHSQGIWNRMDDYEKNEKTIELIDDYNKFLNYTYDEQFSNIRKFCGKKLGNRYLESMLYRH